MTKNILQKLFKASIKELIFTEKSKNPYLLLKTDLRGKIFAIEGVLRLYVKTPPKYFNAVQIALLEKSLLQLKTLEDHLGDFSLSLEVKDFAKSANSKQKQKMDEAIKEAEEKFLVYLKNERVVKTLSETSSKLSKVSWPKDDVAFVKKALAKEVKRIDNKIKDRLAPLILKNKYSHHEIEEGVHEWRRMIRWVSIYIQAYKSHFFLKSSPEKLAKHKALVNTYKKSPFCQLPGKDLRIDQVRYYQLSDYIQKIGELKTEGELAIFLKEKYKLVVKIAPLEKRVHELFEKFTKDKIFKKLLR